MSEEADTVENLVKRAEVYFYEISITPKRVSSSASSTSRDLAWRRRISAFVRSYPTN